MVPSLASNICGYFDLVINLLPGIEYCAKSRLLVKVTTNVANNKLTFINDIHSLLVCAIHNSIKTQTIFGRDYSPTNIINDEVKVDVHYCFTMNVQVKDKTGVLVMG